MEYIEQKPVEVSPKKKRNKLIVLISSLAAAVIAITTAYVLLINLVFLDFNNIELYNYSYRYDLEEGETPTVRIDSIKSYGVYIPSHLRIPNKLNRYPVTEIAEGAFEKIDKIQSVTFPDTITKIGKRAFNGCTKLESFNTPRDIKEIGTDAFLDTKWLDNQPSGEVVIGTLLYTYNGSMAEDSIIVATTDSPEYSAGHTGDIIVLSELSNLTDGVFSGQENLVYAEMPASYGRVRDELFKDCIGLEKVVIEDGLTGIGVSSFEGCESLSEINLPNSITSIGELAFSMCNLSGDLVLPTGLKTLGSSAFEINRHLTSVTIPYGLDTIPSSAFSKCTDLSNVILDEKEFNTETSLIRNIGSSAFYSTSLVEFHFPFNVETVNSSSFEGISTLERVYAYNNLTQTYKNQVASDFSVEKTSSTQGIIRLDQRVFYNDTSFVGFVLVDSNNNALTPLDEVNFPVTLKQLSSSASDSYFFANSGVKRVNFGVDFSGVTNEEYKESLQKGSFSYVAPRLLQGCESLEEITFTDSKINIIYISAFANCPLLNNVVLPENLTSLGTNAFEGCESLSSIVFNDKIGAIQDKTFYGCKSLESIALPNSVKSIGKEAFGECTNLATVSLNASESLLMTIDKYAFNNCSSLTSFTMPNGVTSLGEGAFAGCTSLSTVNISSHTSLKKVEKDLFKGCAIVTITLEKNIWTIASLAFEDCANLEEIIIKNDLRVVALENIDAFSGTKITASTGVIKVPASFVDSYKENSSWSTFADRIVADE